MPSGAITRALITAHLALLLALWCAYQGWDNATRLDRVEKAIRVACVPQVGQSKADSRLEACAIMSLLK